MAEMSGIFEAAVTRSGELQDWVMQRQTDAITQAQLMRDAAIQGIDAMSDFTPKLGQNVAPPQTPELVLAVDVDMNLPELTNASFGTVDAVNRPDFVPTPVAPVSGITIKEFEPAVQTIVIPDAPEPIDHGQVPDAPTLTPIQLPAKPVLEKPNLPTLDDVTIPEFLFPVLPVFDAQAPEWQESSISTVLQWSEIPYELTIIEDVQAKLRQMWAGGTGLPPAVEQAMWERAGGREDVSAARDISAAMVDFSSRGFSLPSGVMVDRIDAIRSDAQLRKQAIGRDVLIKVTDTQIENLRFACVQAISTEQVLIGIWQQIASRHFEAAKIQLDSELALLNARIAIFNAKQSAYATEATVFRAKLEAALATIQVFRAQVDAELAKGQVNEQRVRTYSEQIKALLADIEVYKTEMQGAELESNLQRNLIEVFKGRIQAFAEVVQADKTRFDAYDSRMKGEGSKAQIVESQARMFAAYVSGKSAQADIGFRNQQAQIATGEQALRAYVANLDRDKTLIQQQGAAIGAAAEAHRANTSRYVARAQVEGTKAELQLKAADAGMARAIQLYEIEIRRYIADMEQMIRAAGLQLEALKSAGQATATMAAGAMAGVSVGASVSASAGISASGSENISQSI